MAMPSKPYPGENPGLSDLLTPMISVVPASPARPPQIDIVSTRVREMLMPAQRAPTGLRPTARNSNPSVDRNSSHETNRAARSARMNPQFIRSPSISGGMVAAGSTIGDTGSLRPGRW